MSTTIKETKSLVIGYEEAWYSSATKQDRTHITIHQHNRDGTITSRMYYPTKSSLGRIEKLMEKASDHPDYQKVYSVRVHLFKYNPPTIFIHRRTIYGWEDKEIMR